MRVAAPTPSAPSGVLYRVGLKSDLTELVLGAPGTVWIVASTLGFSLWHWSIM